MSVPSLLSIDPSPPIRKKPTLTGWLFFTCYRVFDRAHAGPCGLRREPFLPASGRFYSPFAQANSSHSCGGRNPSSRLGLLVPAWVAFNTHFAMNWHFPKSVEKYDVKTEMENCKCSARNMPPSSKTSQIHAKTRKASTVDIFTLMVEHLSKRGGMRSARASSRKA